MKKKLLALAMVFAMVFALAACGGGSGESEEAAPAEKTAVNVFAAASLGSVMAEFEAAYEEENPDVAVVEMDSVESSRDSSKVLLTLHFCSCNLMLAFLRDANTARSVTDIFNDLQDKLGMELFQKLFPVILTDRGSEFTDPSSIECDAATGELRTRVFYCDPRRSDQKGSIEVTHEFIRRVLPKGTSFEFLTQEKVNLMMDHINSYKRKKLNDQSPHQLFSFLYGADVLETLPELLK